MDYFFNGFSKSWIIYSKDSTVPYLNDKFIIKTSEAQSVINLREKLKILKMQILNYNEIEN